MRKMLTYIHDELLLFVAFTALLLTGCAGRDALVEEVLPQEEGTVELCLNIGVGNAQASRSPLGGEDGDGREMGQHHENDVNKLLIFYYNSPAGISAADETTVKKLAYLKDANEILLAQAKADEAKNSAINDDPACPHPSAIPYLQKTLLLSAEQTNYYTYKQDDHYIVITNMDEFAPANLGELRDYLVTKPWTTHSSSIGGYNNFVMSNEHESFCNYAGEGTKEDPYKIVVTIERVAARIDFAFDPAVTTQTTLGAVPVLHYDAKDTPKGGGLTKYGDVNLTHVRPFNVMQAKETPLQGSFLIKRSATPASTSDYTYLKPENAYDGSASSTFPLVIEPTTWGKLSADDAKRESWYGDTRSSLVDEYYASDDNYKVHHATANDGFDDGLSTDGGINYYVLDYANENTMRVDESLKDFATGYILRAVYVPLTVYEGVWSGSPLTMTSITTVSYTAGTTFYRYRPLVKEFDESQARYFTKEADATEYGRQQLEKTGVPYVIETYTNGVCYYPAYIRHDNAGGSPNVTPMEFGVVRNNIYRLKVTFSGPGYTTPEIQNTEPLGIKPYIYTRPWYKVVHEEITI